VHRKVMQDHVDGLASMSGRASSRKFTNSSLVWRGTQRPTTFPRCTSKAANSETVPRRTYSTVCRSGRLGCSGNAGCVRSTARIAVFSSMQKMAVFSGGCKYKPRTSLALASKFGSGLAL
jgi:hypothetical protein